MSGHEDIPEAEADPVVGILEDYGLTDTHPDRAVNGDPGHLPALVRRWRDETLHVAYRDATGHEDPHPPPWVRTHPADRVDPLQALAAARVMVDWLTSYYRHMVGDARDTGSSWSEIGDALGVSKQAAWEAYRDAEGLHAAMIRECRDAEEEANR